MRVNGTAARGIRGAVCSRRILLADDNSDDVFLLQTAFRRAGLPVPIQVVDNGQELIDRLEQSGRYADGDHPIPSLLVLDLRMPEVDGFGVLEWLRRRPELAGLRVVVLSGCVSELDLERAKSLGAEAVLTKPVDFDELVSLARQLILLSSEQNGAHELRRESRLAA